MKKAQEDGWGPQRMGRARSWELSWFRIFWSLDHDPVALRLGPWSVCCSTGHLPRKADLLKPLCKWVVMRQTAEDHREMDLVIWGRGQISRVLFIDK